jgi:serine/threonine protein kinase
MGEVHRARDPRLGREVAIKVLPEGVASTPERLARFEREARAVAGLNHPNIVVLHSIEDADGIRFITMEMVDGENLGSLVAPGGLPLPRLLELTIPLAEALGAAHERGVVHRDLKPANVMVTREGRIKVLTGPPRRARPTRRNRRPRSRARPRHGGWGDPGHAPLHGAGADPRRGRGRPHRPVLVRRAAL